MAPNAGFERLLFTIWPNRCNLLQKHALRSSRFFVGRTRAPPETSGRFSSEARPTSMSISKSS